MTTSPLDYKAAGVDIEAGNQLVDTIKTLAPKTHRPGVMAGVGGFGALFELPLERYTKPILVSATDGVGTKLKLALAANKHDTIGIDLVAMSVNDILTLGAEPLFFLDYYATGHLENEIAKQVIEGIVNGCQQAGVALIGGETAEMPGMYAGQDYDLAGFCVGIVEKDRILDGSRVQPGDALIALASSGPHANGYSLIRKIMEQKSVDLDALLTPTKIYVSSILPLLSKVDVHALAHITGGGIIENLPRVLPDGCRAAIESNSWEWPDIFKWLQRHGNVADSEMLRTFNCGIGMIIVVPEQEVDNTLQHLDQAGEIAWHLGHIAADQGQAKVEFV